MAGSIRRAGGSFSSAAMLAGVLASFLISSQLGCALDWCVPGSFWREIEVASNWPVNPYNGSGLTGSDLCSNFNSSGGYEMHPFDEYAHTIGEFMQDAKLTWKNSPRFYWIRQPSELLYYNITIVPIGAPHIRHRASRYLIRDHQPLVGEYKGTVLDRSFEINCARASKTAELWSIYYTMRMISPVHKIIVLRILQKAYCNTSSPRTTFPPPSTSPGLFPASARPFPNSTSSAKLSSPVQYWMLAVIGAAGFFVTVISILLLRCVLLQHKRATKKPRMRKVENKEYGDITARLHPFADCLIHPDEVHIEKEVGKGAFGVVYVGTCRDERVAIKTMKVSSGASDAQHIRFLQEAVTMKQFRHANLLNLIGVCLPENDSPQIIVPYMDQGDLHSFLRRHNRDMLQVGGDGNSGPDGIEELSDNLLYCIMLQVALAMAYLSQHSFVHRDLAARNCMLDRALVVKVGDFGLGRHMNDEPYYRVSSEFMLPVKWMAPESLLAHKFTSKSDVWSYGVLMWEVESLGRTPYFGISNAQMPDFIAGGNRLTQPEKCPEGIFNVMKECWQDDPDQRPTFFRILQLLEVADRQQFYSMTRSPLYMESCGPGPATPSTLSHTASFPSLSDDASTATRTTTVPLSYVNETGRLRSISTSSSAFANNTGLPYAMQPPLPLSSAQYLPSVSYSAANNNHSAIAHIPYSDMQAFVPREFAPIPNGVAPASPPREAVVAVPSQPNEPTLSSPSSPSAVASAAASPAAAATGACNSSHKALSPRSSLARGSSLQVQGDPLRPRTQSDPTNSLPRPFNLYISTPLRALPPDTTSPSSSDTAYSPDSPAPVSTALTDPIVQEVSNDTVLAPPTVLGEGKASTTEPPVLAVPKLLAVDSEFMPKEEGAIVNYQNCLVVQQPGARVGVETEA